MGSSARAPRYRWKEGKEADLRDYVDGRVRGGVSITQALKEYGQRNKMSWLTARWKYYQVRSERALSQGAAPLSTARVTQEEPVESSGPRQSRDDDFLGYLQDLVRATEESGQDIVPFIKGFSRMAVLSKESMRLREETASLRERLAAVETEIAKHSHHLSEWLDRSQVEKVSVLKEFSDTMARDLEALGQLRERLADS